MISTPANSAISPQSRSPIAILMIGVPVSDGATYTKYLQAKQDRDYEIVTVKHWIAGQEQWRSQPADVVLLDLSDATNLAFLEWFQFHSTPNSLPSKMPVIVLIEAHQESLAKQALQQGAMDYLEKATLTSLALCKSVAAAIDYQALVQQLIVFKQNNCPPPVWQTTRKTTELLPQDQSIELGNLSLREQLNSLRKTNPNIIYTCHDCDNYSCTFISQNVEQLLGYSQTDFLSEPNFWVNRLHPEDAPQVFADLLKLFVNGMHKNEYRFQHREGHYVWLRDELMLVRDVQGNPIEIVGCFTDLSDRTQTNTKQQDSFDHFALISQLIKQLAIANQQASVFEQLQIDLTQRQQAQEQLTERNQQLALKNQKLARATRLKDEFLANMSHELRTPLNAIFGMAEALEDKAFGHVNDRQLQALQIIEDAGRHLLALINDILDVAKIEADRLELEKARVNVSYLCESSLNFVRQQALEKNIHITHHIPNDLPDILIDERRMRQVLINLFNNAVKFTPDGGHITLDVLLVPTSTNTIETKTSGTKTSGTKIGTKTSGAETIRASDQSMIQFVISDTGIGISEENMKRLFQPFVQLDSVANQHQGGTGLGLTLVKQIVELHEGTVDVTSTHEKGTCFTLSIPLQQSTNLQMSEPIGAVSATSQPLTFVEGNAPLILLVEDDKANVVTMTEYLEVKGYQVLVADHGEMAIALVQSQRPDLILMDIHLPGMDGLEATRQIRADQTLANIPIIALTALAMSGDEERCLAAGASAYLSKPIRLKELTAVIQQWLCSVVA